MEQRKVVLYKWHELKNIINKLYKENSLLCPYQSYEFLDTVKLGRIDKNPLATKGYHEQNFVLFRDEQPIAIAPMYSKKNGELYDVVFRGALTSAGHLDFIYDNSYSFDDYLFLMGFIKNYYQHFSIHFDRVSERSKTYQFAVREEKYDMISSDMVSVMLPETYDDWYKALSKSVRQNIRTAYNRMNTDGKTYEFKFYNRERFDKKTNCDTLNLFARRLCEHSKLNPFLLQKVLYGMKKRHPMTKGINDSPYFIGATVYIDGVLAAFMTGFVGNDKRILVPRLSINLDLGRYSPGGLLINELMKVIIREDKAFSEFDLQRGDEPYKFSYGGKEYNNFEWMVSD